MVAMLLLGGHGNCTVKVCVITVFFYWSKWRSVMPAVCSLKFIRKLI